MIKIHQSQTLSLATINILNFKQKCIKIKNDRALVEKNNLNTSLIVKFNPKTFFGCFKKYIFN